MMARVITMTISPLIISAPNMPPMLSMGSRDMSIMGTIIPMANTAMQGNDSDEL